MNLACHWFAFNRPTDQRAGRLQPDDLDWLNQTLMPLLLNEASPNNAALLSYLAPGDTETLSSSLIRLLNTEILVREGVGPQQSIAFKFERFFDYFAGLRLRRLDR